MNGDEVLIPQAAPLEVPEPVTEPAAGSPLTPEVRGRLLAQFEQWLDRLVGGEPLPEGLPEELMGEARAAVDGQAPPPHRECDLYALFAGLTRLTGEIKLQGRAFKQLCDALAPLGEMPRRLERLESASVDCAEELSRLTAASVKPESALPAAKDALHVVFDLIDRMERGLRTFDAGMASVRASVCGGLLWRLSGGAKHLQGALTAAAALREGYELTLSRLQAAMQQWGIDRVGRAGDIFDPRWMTAADVQATDEVPPGTVLEVYRSGYAIHGQALATAQVKVAKARE